MLSRLDRIKKFIKNENDIKGILNTMCNIEKNEGQNSLKLNSLTGLLKDFLNDEEKMINEFSNDQVFFANYLAKKNLILIDEIEAAFFDQSTLIQYRLFKLMNSLNDFDLINVDTYLELIKTSNDIDLKYNLSFINPILMNLLIRNNFDHQKIDISEYKDKNYEIKKLSFLIKKCADFIIFMIDNKKIDDVTCLNYLKVLKLNINDDNFNNICNILVKIGYEFNNIEQIFTNLKEKTHKKLD